MEIHFNSELQSRLDRLAVETGREAAKLVEDATAAYLDELSQVRQTLDSRYDDIKSGKVRPIDGETFFESLRTREEELLKSRARQ